MVIAHHDWGTGAAMTVVAQVDLASNSTVGLTLK